MKSSIPDIFFNSCFKNNNKKNGFDLKNVHISQKKIGKQICYHNNHDNMCITFFEHSWYLFYILALKII